jgi:hypothetical protein
LVFRDQFPFSLDQQAEQIERARAERDRRGDTSLIQPEQTPKIKAEGFEQESVGRSEPVRASVSGNFGVSLTPRNLTSPLVCGEPIQQRGLSNFLENFGRF